MYFLSFCILPCNSGSEIQAPQYGCTWAAPMTSLDLHRAATTDWNLVQDAQGRTESRTPFSWLSKVLHS